MRKPFLITALCCYLLDASAQNKVTDSLLSLLKKAPDDTAKVMLYLRMGTEIENSQPAVARDYYTKAGELSRKLGYGRGRTLSYTNYGGTFMIEGKPDSLLYYAGLALASARQQKDSLYIGVSLFNIGLGWREKSEYEKAIDYCLQGRTVLENSGDAIIIFRVNDALQILYNARTDYDKAIQYGTLAVQEA
ncbi:MAG: hypothetical protein JST39_24795, partial [Bacteroidetes bacterium]|nr:hypothetical protein [Bacteroidota bacterium]